MDDNKQIGDDDGKEKLQKNEFCADKTPKLKKKRSSNQENEATKTKKVRDHFQSPTMPFYYPLAYPPPMAPINHVGFPANWSPLIAAIPPPSKMHQSPYFWGNTAFAFANLNHSNASQPPMMDQSVMAFPAHQDSSKSKIDLSNTDPNEQISPLSDKESKTKILEIGQPKGNSPIDSDEKIAMRKDETTTMDLSDQPCSSLSLFNADKESENTIDDEILILECKNTKSNQMPKMPTAFSPIGMGPFWPYGGYLPYFHPFAGHYPRPYFQIPIPPNAHFSSPLNNLSISSSKEKNVSKNVEKEIENKEKTQQLMDEKEEQIMESKIGAEFRKVKKEANEENKKEGKGIKVNREEGICSICGDISKTKHYGVSACEGCKGFFLRIVKLEIDKRNAFKCVTGKNKCKMTREIRNFCQFCRYKGCLNAGMNKEAVLKRIGERATAGKKENSKKKVKNGQEKEETNKLIELLNIICKSFKNQRLHRRSATLTTLSELNGKIDAFLKAIFETKKIKIREEQQKMLKEKGMEVFLIIRHVFMDDFPILREFLASKNGNFDFGENEQKLLELLMKKVDKFRLRLSVNVFQLEEQAILSALAFFHHKNGNLIDGIGNIFGELINCLHTQMTIRDPNRFNHRAYNALCRNLEELMTN